MSLLDRIFAEPELVAEPPVLVDVGAAGGVHRAWSRIARYAVGVAFEPDARERAPLSRGQREFRRWVICPRLVLPEVGPDGNGELHLARQPQCSSVLAPNEVALGEWSFAEFFETTERRRFPAVTLQAALSGEGLERLDWLKCDTQGLDLRIFLSLPEPWRARVLAVEFEPGLMDAYQGEDKLKDVLAAMEQLPFWLADLQVEGIPRVQSALVSKHLGPGVLPWVRRLAAKAPGWANVRYLREVSRDEETLDRRSHLLAWVFATLAEQHGSALAAAAWGAERFGGRLFQEMTASSVQRLRWQMLRGLPAAIWRRSFGARRG